MSNNKVYLGQLETLIVANTSTVLGAGGVFVGDVFNVSGYTHISGFAFSDVDSAANGLIIEQAFQSSDFTAGTANTGLITRSLYSITGADMDNNSLAVQIVAPFARIIYTNGAAGQATFRMHFAARILRGL